MLNRRAFFHRVGVGIVGAFVLARVPASMVDGVGLHQLSRDRIRDQMRRIYNDAAKGGAHPREIHLGREAYATYMADLLQNERFVEFHTENGKEFLMFKAAIVRPIGAGWGMRIVP